MPTRLTYYTTPHREEATSRIHQELQTLISDSGATIVEETTNNDEVTFVVEVDPDFEELLKEMFEEALEHHAIAAPKQSLQTQARELVATRVNDPAYQFSPGVTDITAVARSVAEDLGHLQWVNEEQHWLWRLIDEALN